ncbi:MAG TPA: hypothetical protein VMX33_12485 [bacterium]|nr:hypothetical protein [bacterium]
MKIFRRILAISIMALATFPAIAQDKADPRVKEALDSIGIKYSVNTSNNYKVVYSMDKDKDRSQLAFIVSETVNYRNLEVREVWSVAAVMTEYPGQDVIQKLMAMNSTTKIGAWAIEEADDGKFWVLYTVKVPAALSPKELADIVYFVAEVSDELEVELVGDDEY